MAASAYAMTSKEALIRYLHQCLFSPTKKTLLKAIEMINALNIKIAVDMAVAYSGATGHFVLPGTKVSDMKISKKSLTINLPDGTQLKSTHTCEIALPWIPKEARRSHIVPGMAHTSLISLKVLIDAGFKVVYDAH